MMAGAVTFLAHPLYVVAILKGETKPHILTWIPSAILAGITLFLYGKAGGEETIYVPLGDFIGFGVIAILSLWYGGKGSISWDDWVCFAIAFFSIYIYLVFGDPIVAFYASLVAEVFALIPTIKKTFYHPEQEDFVAWTFTFLGNLLNFFAIANRVEIVYVWVIFIADGIVWALVLRGKQR